MKKILCFGDSNTYGYNPLNGHRYSASIRWTGILKSITAKDYEIIEGGCNNRTCFSDNPAGVEQTGYKILPSYLEQDLDLVILTIGVNDLQKSYNPLLEDIETGIKNMVMIVKKACPTAKILLASPSVLTTNVLSGGFASLFDRNSIEKSLHLAPIYEKVSKENDCYFLDLNHIARVCKRDGLHYDETSHRLIARAMYKFLHENI